MTYMTTEQRRLDGEAEERICPPRVGQLQDILKIQVIAMLGEGGVTGRSLENVLGGGLGGKSSHAPENTSPMADIS